MRTLRASIDSDLSAVSLTDAFRRLIGDKLRFVVIVHPDAYLAAVQSIYHAQLPWPVIEIKTDARLHYDAWEFRIEVPEAGVFISAGA